MLINVTPKQQVWILLKGKKYLRRSSTDNHNESPRCYLGIFKGGLAPPGFPLYRPSPLSLTMILCMMRNSVSKLRSERAKQKEGNMKTLANIIGCALRKVSVINVRRWRRKRKDVKDMTMLTWLPPIDCLKVLKTKNWAHQKCGQAKLPSNATQLASFTIFGALDFIYFVPSFLLNLAI